MLAERGMSVGDFAEAIGITPANVTVLKNGRAKAVRFTTLDAICHPHGCARRAALAEELVAEAEQWLGLPLRAPAQGAGTAGLGRGWPTSPKSTPNQAKVAEDNVGRRCLGELSATYADIGDLGHVGPQHRRPSTLWAQASGALRMSGSSIKPPIDPGLANLLTFDSFLSIIDI